MRRGGGEGADSKSITSSNLGGGPTSTLSLHKEARIRASSLEVPQAIGGGCPNVVEEAHKLVASHFAFGEDMVACREVFSAVALFG